jgi:hypothetical protein
MIPKNVIYLENNYTEIAGISFYSVSARPWLHEFPQEKRKIDFLLTHGPAYAILDLNLGCKQLLSYVKIRNLNTIFLGIFIKWQIKT